MKQDEQEIKDFLDQEMGSEEPLKPTHSEAPASVNVKVWIEGYGTMFTFRGNDMVKVIDQVSNLIFIAKEKEWKPSWITEEQPTKATPTYQQPARPTPPPAEGTPICKIHGRPMREFNGRYGPFFKCTTRLADGSYCNEKAVIM